MSVLALLLVGAVLGALAVWFLSQWSRGRNSPAPTPGDVSGALARVEEQLHRMESDRQASAGGLAAQLRSLQDSQEILRGETTRLGRALREPSARGRWGELQLRRVVEMAGLLSQCDFVEQPLLRGEEGVLRPDLVVRLPGGRNLVVDAKVPLRGWLEALEAPDEPTRRACVADHARQLRNHVSLLSAKEYWARLSGSPEMVVAFLPADGLLAAALEADPSLLDYAVGQRVMLATPMTLIALLRAVSFGWREEALVDNARVVAELGRDLHRRLGVLSEHLTGLGRSLDRTVASFNQTVGSLESRVLVTARRLGELAGPGSGPEPPRPSLATVRSPSAPGALASTGPENGEVDGRDQNGEP